MKSVFTPYKEKNSFCQVEGSVPMTNRGVTKVRKKISLLENSKENNKLNQTELENKKNVTL